MEELITFQDLEGNTVQISKNDLGKHLFSLLTKIALPPWGRNNGSNIFHVSFRGPTLEIVAEFYQNDIWRNPYIFGNQLEVDGVYGTFDAICEYLGLPAYPIQDSDDDIYDEDMDDIEDDIEDNIEDHYEQQDWYYTRAEKVLDKCELWDAVSALYNL